MPAEDEEWKALGSAATDPGGIAAAPATRSEHPEPVAGPVRTVVGGVGLPTPEAPSTLLMHAGSPPEGATAFGARDSNTPLAGKVVKGRYLIKRLLGEGGMGGVFEGEHIEIGRRVAIKLVSLVHARDPHVAARIKQEARSTSAIESEHIVQVFDAGEDDELGLFLVMELLKGEDLAAMLDREKRLSPLVAITLVAQAAQGLARAHAARIVHRDLKPANIFICPRDDGSLLVKLVDFGIAKLLREASDKEAGALTRLGMVIGTPQYMSPEQAQGLATVDHRTDVYSLGAVLFEIVAGVPPIAQMPTYEQTILQIMMKQAPRLRSVVPEAPEALDDLCAEMMASDPAARPQEMSRVRDRLVRILADLGGTPLMGASASGGWRAMEASGAWRTSSFGGAASSSLGSPIPGAPRVSAPGTQLAVVVDPASPGHDDVHDVAGLPPRRSPWVPVAALVAAALAAGLVYARGSSPTSESASSARAGLVEDPHPVVAVSPVPSASEPAPAPASITSAALSSPGAAASAAPVAAASSTKAPAPTASPHAARPKTGVADKPAASKTAHQVGATPAAEEF